MAATFPASIVVAVFLFPAVAVVYCSFPTTLTLQRGIPQSHLLELNQLKERDSYRRSILLENTAVAFPVQGSFDPLLIGLYYAKVQLGSPPKDYYVQIDTGSDILWVSCASCKGCPASSGLGIKLSFYDPGTSASASLIPCWDNHCSVGFQSSDSFCPPETNQCGFALKYRNGISAFGYYVLDLLHMDTLMNEDTIYNFSAPIVFGCNAIRNGNMTNTNKAVDGIFGFGQQKMSVISQLAAQGITPKIFSHCLKGDGKGGGFLVLGKVTAPKIVYTPLAPSRSLYGLYLLGVSVAGKALAINPSVFKTSSDQGTIIDSGTALAYLVEGIYAPLVKAMSDTVLKNGLIYPSNGKQCYLVHDKIDKVFPQVSFNFALGASMKLNPKEYLLKLDSLAGEVWCIGFQRSPGQKMNVLGDLVLRDKVIVYDMERQEIGWANHNCDLPLKVSTATNLGGLYSSNEGSFHFNNSIVTMIALLLLLLLHVFAL